MTIAEFLLARIAEDEAVAQDALERGFGGWEDFADRGLNYEERTHIVRWHPARALAECEAKRRIVEERRWSPSPRMECDGHPGSFMPHGDYGPGFCMYQAEHEGESSSTLRVLAAVYADHPDCNEAWRP